MTNHTDDIYLGAAQLPPLNSVQSTNQGVGPMGRTAYLNIVPLTKQAANVAALQASTSGVAFAITAGTGATAGLAPDGTGRPVIVLDTNRCVSLTSGANLSGVNYTITGFDIYGRLQTQTRAGPNNTTVNTTKAFASVLSIVPSATNAGTMSVGMADIFGFSWSIIDAGLIIPKWANALAQDAGTLVVADATSPATAATGDPRGTYAPSSASDGSKRLVVWAHLMGVQVGPTATQVGAIGVQPA